MKKAIIIIAVVALLAGGAYLGFYRSGPKASAQVEKDAATPTLPAVAASRDVVADAKVVPVQSANLSLSTGGIVAETLVAEGDQVVAGQPLVRLEASRQRAAVAQAEASLQSSQARLADLEAGARSEEIAAARAALAAAQANLDKVTAGPEDAQVITARADLANAEAALRQAQAAYDRVKWASDIGARPESAQLEQATNNYTAAQARLDDLLKGPNAADVEGARAQVRQAQAELDLRQAGARRESILAAEADVAVTSAALEQAMVALGEMELKAPFTGTVAALNVKVGEQVAGDTPVVRLADLSSWRIETEDLTELNVVNVKEGDPVQITFDAIPDLELPGRVERIKSIGENKQGDITYTVVIVPEKNDERLRWNMTASVTIANQ